MTIKPWDRLDRETAKQFAAFCVYRDMGAARSIDRTYAIIKGPSRTGRANRHMTQWCSDNEWVKRAAAYDVHIMDMTRNHVEQIEKVAAERIHAAREAHKADEAALCCLLGERLREMLRHPVTTERTTISRDGKTYKTIIKPSKWTQSTTAIMARVFSDLGRRALGIPNTSDDPLGGDDSMRDLFFKSRGQMARALPDGAMPPMPADTSEVPNISRGVNGNGSNGHEIIKPEKRRPM